MLAILFNFLFLLLLSWFQISEALETKADEVLFDSQNGICTLMGNAEAKEDAKSFSADKIIIYQKPQEKYPSKIIASNNVRYSQDQEKVIITADHCESNLEVIIFSQNVRIKHFQIGDIQADKVVYNIKNKTIDISSQKKVKLVLDKSIETKLITKTKKRDFRS